jgi:ribosomal-protein-alanine N-acetyltransferase
MSGPPLIALHVTLREWSESDAHWYAESTLDPAIQRFTTEPAHLTVGEVRDAIRSLAASDNRHAGLVITDTMSGQRLGSIAVDRAGEVSYWLAAPARGRGVATIALRCLSEWIFATTETPELWLRTHSQNTASQFVAIRAGYERDPARDDQALVKGEAWTRVAYKLVRPR